MTALGQGYHELQISSKQRTGYLIADLIFAIASAVAISHHDYGWATFFVLWFYRMIKQ